MNNALIGVGSNIDPEKNVIRAEREVSLLGKSFKKSKFIYTKPLLYEKQNDFLNGVFFIKTTYDYIELNNKLKKIETRLGRIRTNNKSGPRTIDLDTVIFNNQVKDRDVFTRDFIRIPVTELLPELKSILTCSNYKNHFKILHGIIEKILSLLPETPSTILGTGSWFNDIKIPGEDIGILLIVEDIVEKSDEAINLELKRSGLSIIDSLPVQVRLIRSKLLKDISDGEVNKGRPPYSINSVDKGLPSYKLLYGNPGLLF